METIYGSRASGKTTRLVERSAKTGEVIICNTYEQTKTIKCIASKLQLTIPEPTCVSSINNGKFIETNVKFLVDDADCIDFKEKFMLYNKLGDRIVAETMSIINEPIIN
jgi:hypothetical protein